MPLWQWLLDSAGAALLLLILYGLALVVRRRLLARRGGTFELSYRVQPRKAGRGWLLGIGRYSGDSLEWFRIFSLWPRAKRCWPRAALTYTGHRQPEGVEKMSLFGEHVVVVCRTPNGDLELAMSPSSLTGFQSWLESAPPGTQRIV